MINRDGELPAFKESVLRRNGDTRGLLCRRPVFPTCPGPERWQHMSALAFLRLGLSCTVRPLALRRCLYAASGNSLSLTRAHAWARAASSPRPSNAENTTLSLHLVRRVRSQSRPPSCRETPRCRSRSRKAQRRRRWSSSFASGMQQRSVAHSGVRTPIPASGCRYAHLRLLDHGHNAVVLSSGSGRSAGGIRLLRCAHSHSHTYARAHTPPQNAKVPESVEKAALPRRSGSGRLPGRLRNQL